MRKLADEEMEYITNNNELKMKNALVLIPPSKGGRGMLLDGTGKQIGNTQKVVLIK